MSPVDPKQLAALLKTGAASPDPLTEVALEDGTRLRYHKAVSPDIALEIDAVAADGSTAVLLRNFGARPARPAEYPDAVPFVPNTAATLSEAPDGYVLVWEIDDDPDPAVKQVLEQSEADGWKLDPAAEITRVAPMMGFRAWSLQKGGRARSLSTQTLFKATVTLIEGKAGARRAAF